MTTFLLLVEAFSPPPTAHPVRTRPVSMQPMVSEAVRPMAVSRCVWEGLAIARRARLPSPVLTGCRFEGLRPFPHSQRRAALPCRSGSSLRPTHQLVLLHPIGG